MWNLNGDDIERAKADLMGRRAAVQAHYDNEMKQIESDLSNLEMFERAAMSFVANFKHGEEPAPVAAPEPEPAAVEPDGAAEPAAEASAPVESVAEMPAADKPTAEKGSSRWRMRLSSAETTS